jgi:diguanylate cyclase (GGDEF)-like protein
VDARAESELGKKTEDEAKVGAQTGAVTALELSDLLSNVLTEVVPLWQTTIRMHDQVDRLDKTVQSLLAETDPSRIVNIEQQMRASFGILGALSKRLAGRLRDADGQVRMRRIRQALAQLETAISEPGALLDAQRQAAAANAEVAKGRITLDRIDSAYLGILDDVKRAVGSLNQAARRHAASDIAWAGIVIVASILLAVAAALVFGFVFARRITAPVERLASHAAGIGRSGELQPLADIAVTVRADEIGMLARSFNQMIAELTEARQRLIDWSEAEIAKQYGRLNAAIDNMPQGLCMFDAEQRLIICNRRYAEIYRLLPEHTLPGTPLRAILEQRLESGVLPRDEHTFVADRLAAIAAGKPFYLINELADGHVIAVTHQPMLNGGSVATHEDITERRKAEAKIAYMAHHDALTDLPNRLRFHEEMERALGSAARGGTLAVLCLDLDHFKDVNDTLGHPVGDALLQAVSRRICAIVRPSDTVARLGGDEFAIVQVGADQPVGATTLAARLIREIAEPFDVQGHQVVIGTSIGIALTPHDGEAADHLLKNADMALYRAKEDGRGIYRFFEPEMDARMQARRAMELDLRKALPLREFELFYQPVIDVRSEQVTELEALLRWRHPQRGLVAPAEFIPLAEEIGLINPIGAWVLKRACHEATHWPDGVKVAVNLSPVQFKGGTIVLDVIAALGESGLPPRRLELEITEAVLLQDTDATVATLNQLRDLGVHIAMDDFGTGYSSLGYLRKFPFDKIKIDRSFVHDMTEKPDSVAIVRAVTGLGTTLGIATTAEGVETEAQFEQLRREGCTEVQGYLFSEPKPASELGPLLQGRKPARAVA